ncbi:MAG TPA: hypothetical protein VFE17_10155 [Candidatus Baltobacteraceae bacterium]|jgi:hypothetical protein|nr:hypothetical protein [Candidatus Baltobacteraceae bacterium]
MKRGLFSLTLIAFSLFAAHAYAAPMASAKPKIPDTPLPSEVAFVQQVTKDLNARFPTPAAAVAAGYFRYNNEDDTGAISYANLQWNSAANPASPQPSQLWYDVKGHLLGADYSIPLTAQNSAAPPNIWNVNPQRWFKVSRAHVHYILTGTTDASYGHAVRGTDFTKAGGDFNNPTVAPLVKLGKVKDPATVTKVFTFPAQWNLELWVTPNPLGAFAEKNPLIHPSPNAKAEM